MTTQTISTPTTAPLFALSAATPEPTPDTHARHLRARGDWASAELTRLAPRARSGDRAALETMLRVLTLAFPGTRAVAFGSAAARCLGHDVQPGDVDIMLLADPLQLMAPPAELERESSALMEEVGRVGQRHWGCFESDLSGFKMLSEMSHVLWSSTVAYPLELQGTLRSLWATELRLVRRVDNELQAALAEVEVRQDDFKAQALAELAQAGEGQKPALWNQHPGYDEWDRMKDLRTSALSEALATRLSPLQADVQALAAAFKGTLRGQELRGTARMAHAGWTAETHPEYGPLDLWVHGECQVMLPTGGNLSHYGLCAGSGNLGFVPVRQHGGVLDVRGDFPVSMGGVAGTPHQIALQVASNIDLPQHRAALCLQLGELASCDLVSNHWMDPRCDEARARAQVTALDREVFQWSSHARLNKASRYALDPDLVPVMGRDGLLFWSGASLTFRGDHWRDTVEVVTHRRALPAPR